MRWSVVAAVALSILMSPSPADAQPARTIGVTMGYPAGVGLLWHVSDRVGLRPDVTVSRGTTDTTTTASGFGGPVSTTSSQSDWTVSTGISVLVTLGEVDRLRIYAVPRVAYLRAKTSNDASTGSLGNYGSTTDGVIASGGIGAHYRLGDRVAIFGESGVQYQRQTFETGYSTARSKATLSVVGLRSALGLVVYF